MNGVVHGALLDPAVLTVAPDQTVATALGRVRRADSGVHYYLFVVYLWSRSPGLTAVIAISMVLSMVVAGFAGAIIPMGLTAARQDPAQSSSILLTTVTDIVGFFSFLGIATLLMNWL